MRKREMWRVVRCALVKGDGERPDGAAAARRQAIFEEVSVLLPHVAAAEEKQTLGRAHEHCARASTWCGAGRAHTWTGAFLGQLRAGG